MSFAFDRAPTPRLAQDGALLGFDRMPLDASSQRVTDDEGRMRVLNCPISKATVNPYWGEEIPGWEELGLNPTRKYMMLRPPEELERAAATFYGVQLLDVHEPVTAGDPKREIVAGSIGTDVYFDGEYLRATVAVWTQEAIDGIEDDTKRELSSCYQYNPVMAPGVYKGLRYDGRMVNLRGNHVALVEKGRAGPDVHVHDAQPEGMDPMPNRHARRAAAAKAAKRIHDAFAADAALTPEAIAAMLASDEDLNPDPDAMDGEDDEDGPAEDGEDDEDGPAEDGEDDEDGPAEDGDGNDVTTTARDAAARKRAKDAAARKRARDAAAPAMDADTIRREAVREVQAIERARAKVEPHVGRIRGAMDSAADVYRLALDSAKVKHKGIRDVRALEAMVDLLPSRAADHATVFAADSDEASPLDAVLKGAPRLARS